MGQRRAALNIAENVAGATSASLWRFQPGNVPKNPLQLRLSASPRGAWNAISSAPGHMNRDDWTKVTASLAE